jgi:hypothetical protein
MLETLEKDLEELGALQPIKEYLWARFLQVKDRSSGQKFYYAEVDAPRKRIRRADGLDEIVQRVVPKFYSKETGLDEHKFRARIFLYELLTELIVTQEVKETWSDVSWMKWKTPPPGWGKLKPSDADHK